MHKDRSQSRQQQTRSQITALYPLLLLGFSLSAQAQNFYVATNGVDVPANGSAAQPWATITYALDHVPDGATILVRPGLYSGRVRVRGGFTQGVTVASEIPYQAVLEHSGNVLTIWNDNADVFGITIEGFEVRHSGPGAAPVVAQVQDGFNHDTYNITLRNNIFHDSYNNDILKVNNGTSDVRVIGNLFYNQFGSDEHIDINSVDNVLVEANVFFNDFAASGRPVANDTSSYIVVKDSNAANDEYVGANDVRIRRNIFLHWEGNSGTNFILCGEDGQSFFEARNMLIENNLLLGDSNNVMRAAIGIKGCRDVLVRANTIRGDLPSLAYAMRLNREGANQPISNAQFFNNWWADESGSMDDFSDTIPADVASFSLRNNAYWNAGNALPESSADLINPSDDSQAIHGDPQFQQALVNPARPYWRPAQGQFNGGAGSIAEVFLQLAAYAVADGAGVDSADASQMPDDDLLGLPRGPNPDIGALEREPALIVFADSFEAP